MKGIILAGGTGSRLFPLTKAMNKHLLPVGKYPMIYHAIHKLKNAGIRDLLIVSGVEHMGSIVSLLGSGHDMGISLTYKVQDRPGGIAHALKLAEEFVNGQLTAVILGDNIFADDLSSYIEKFMRQGKGAKILLKKVEDPHRYGIASIHEGKIVALEEKPNEPKSPFAVTGIYLYDHQVFQIIDQLIPSKRGELEITDVNRAYMLKDELTYDFLQGWWVDAGTHNSLHQATQLAKGIELGGNEE